MGYETREMLLILASTLPWVVIVAALIWSTVTANLDRARADGAARGPRRGQNVGWAAGDQLRPAADPAKGQTRASSARRARRPASANVRSARA